MSDHFDELHRLLKTGQYGEVLHLVFDSKTGRVKDPYGIDLNHSWYIIGDIFYKKNDFDFAISCFKKSLEFWSEDIESMLALANTYSELSQPEKSVYWLSEGLKISPDNPIFIYNYANALFDMDKFQEALDYYQKIPSSDPSVYDLATKNIKRCKKLI
jgi:tetratricopeptide (TPR) repeat protein